MLFTKTIYRSDMIRCALCDPAPCSAACREADPAGLLRSVWFDNEKGAALSLPPRDVCAGCPAPCEDACVRPGQVPVKKLMGRLREEILPEMEEVPRNGAGLLETDICGVKAENPFLLSSSVVASTYEMCARAFEAGWAGAVFKTVCAMDIHEASPRFFAVKGDNGEIMGFKNIEQLSDHSVEENMEVFRRLKREYPTKVIVASIMGRDDDEWESLAALCGENGADAVELNFSCPNMADGGLGSDIGQVPELVERFTSCARRGTGIPVLAKLTPNVASMVPAARAAVRGGADGISAINTIKSVMGINPHTYISSPSVRGMGAVGGYSGPAVKPIALRFISEIAKEPSLPGAHISGMGGIESWTDALEFILLGAGSLQVTTAVMQYGYRIIEDLVSGLEIYMSEKGFTSVAQMRGQGLDSLSLTTDALERDSVLLPVFEREKCIGCGRCALSCRDGGHQAITMDGAGRPRLDGRKCVGCHLCVVVCPQRAVRSAAKRIMRKKK